MGSNSSRSDSKNISKFINAEDNKKLQTLYESVKDKNVSNLSQLWKDQMNQHLHELIMRYVTHKNQTNVDSNHFTKLFAHLVRGSVYDKADVLVDILTDSQRTEPIDRDNVVNYVESLISSYIETLKDPAWERPTKAEMRLMATTLCADLSPQVTHDNILSWITNQPKITFLQATIFGNLYKIKSDIQYLVPASDNKTTPSVLSLCTVMFINASLPAALRNEWRLLFSTSKDGESFSKMIGLIQKKGPTVLVLKDKAGHTFGGFAPHPWALGPNFCGDETSFLFQIKPEMHIYGSTHFNDHYQYVNVQQQTMPNGLGMGGQFNYWGLWIDSEYGCGHSSESCTTYRDCKTLSSTKEFEIDHLEVWAVGPVPVVEDEIAPRSILDTNTEAKAMLEMIGKAAHSDGLREPEEDF